MIQLQQIKAQDPHHSIHSGILKQQSTDQYKQETVD